MEEIKEQDESSVDNSDGSYSLRHARSIPLIVKEIKDEINHAGDAQVEAKRVLEDV